MVEKRLIDRRDFLKTTSCAVAGLAGGLSAGPALEETGVTTKAQAPHSNETTAPAPEPAQTTLPRWRGFNLQYFFGQSDCKPIEDDFRFVSDLGFDFVRLPMWYTHWIEVGDVYKIKESVLEEIDRAVHLGRKYGLHVNLNFHRAPGYCVAPEPKEPFDLWKDQEALDAFCFHWELFAKRYKDIPSSQLSFNLVNEPPDFRYLTSGTIGPADNERVVRTATGTIREVSPNRLVIADGVVWANAPMPELADLAIAQSCRGYLPMTISHYKASWVRGAENFPKPVWPGSKYCGETWDRRRLAKHYALWADLARHGVGVHCGECGCHNRTPHDVFLAWFRDVLEILTSHGIGYALWNLRGSFGILDSGRADVQYEDWHGHKLDRKLLDLLQEF